MNLNKLLCKYFDREGKGYVTIGDGVAVIATLAFLLGIVAMYIQGTILVTESYNSGVCMDEENCTIFESVCLFIHLVGTTVVAIAVVGMIAHHAFKWICAVCETKIATCERKDGD